MPSSVAIFDSGHDLGYFVANALQRSGSKTSAPIDAVPDGSETAIVVFGVQGLNELITRQDCGQVGLGRPRHIIMFEGGDSLLCPQSRVRKRQLELQVQAAALESAPDFTVNAIILENGALDDRLNRDVAATVQFIVSTSAMTGQVFFLG